MTELIVLGLITMLGWSVFSDRLGRWHLTGPVVMVICGFVFGFGYLTEITTELDTEVAEQVTELLLALLLFVDAAEVRGGYLGGQKGVVARLLLIALPLSLALAFGFGVLMLGTSSLLIIALLALVVMPINFAPAAGFLRNTRIPARVRTALAVESGYVDAIRAPIFAFLLIVIQSPEESHDITEMINHALPDILFAIVVGAGIGTLAGVLTRVAVQRGWMQLNGIQLSLVLIPIVTYAVAVSVHGNGFVAAFLAGISYRIARTRKSGGHEKISEKEFTALDTVTDLTSLLMWFLFGAVTTLIFLSEMQWLWVLFSVLAVTLFRFVPVLLSLIGSGLSFREQATIGFMGPRGTSTIVFGLLAFNAFPLTDDGIALYLMVVTVLSSIVLHGFLGGPISQWLVGRWAGRSNAHSETTR